MTSPAVTPLLNPVASAEAGNRSATPAAAAAAFMTPSPPHGQELPPHEPAV